MPQEDSNCFNIYYLSFIDFTGTYWYKACRVKQFNYVTETGFESATKKVTVFGFNFFCIATACVLFFC